MAVDPATQFQQAGLNVPYSFQPTEYRPQAVNVPSQAGELWAQVGKTAMAAGDMLQNSALNPEVRAKMQYGVTQYNNAQDQIAYLRSLGPIGHLFTQTGAEGGGTIAPGSITDPTMAARLMEAMKTGPKVGGGGKGPKKATGTGTGSNGDQEEKQQKEQKPTPPTIQQSGTPPTTQQSGTPPQTSTDTDTSNLAASTDNDFLIGKMMAERQAAGLGGSSAAPQGTPSSLTFLNPATGNIEPRMFTAPTAAPPPAAPAQQPGGPQPQPTQPATPGTVPGSLSDQYAKQQLAQWQAQNAHPVASSTDAVNWAKGYDTRTQDATYLQHGGPNGEPAYAFHMKGGGVNTVPISQMVKNGFGPSVAGQNTSAMLSTSDALMNPPPGQAPGMTLGATGQPPSGMQLGQPQPGQQPPGQAPPAPGQSYQPTDYRTAAEQGQPPGAYAAQPYQQAVAQAAAIPQNLMAQTARAGQPAQTTQPPPSADTVLTAADRADIEARAQRMQPKTGPYTGDTRIEDTTGPYTYYRNEDPDSDSYGHAYTVLPGQAGEYYNPQRWYLGTGKYENYELPDSYARKLVKDYWVGRGVLSGPQVDKMQAPDLRPWLGQMWRDINLKPGYAGQGLDNDLDKVSTIYKNTQAIQDITETLAKNGFADLSDSDRQAAARYNEGLRFSPENRQPRNFMQGALKAYGDTEKSFARMNPNATKAILTLEQKKQEIADLVTKYPDLLVRLGEGGAQHIPDLDLGAIVRGLPVGIKLGVPDVKPQNVLDGVFSGRDISDKRPDLQGFKDNVAARYAELIGEAHTNWQRTSDAHEGNVIKMSQNQRLSDPTNRYDSQAYPNQLTDDQIMKKVKENPKAYPTITNDDDLRSYQRDHPGEPYIRWNNEKHKYEILQ